MKSASRNNVHQSKVQPKQSLTKTKSDHSFEERGTLLGALDFAMGKKRKAIASDLIEKLAKSLRSLCDHIKMEEQNV